MKLNSLESSLRDYSDPYILVTGNINVTGGNNNTKVVFKNCAPFKKCRTEVNEIFVDDVQHINIAMPMSNLIEYSDNYSDTYCSLWQFKRDEMMLIQIWMTIMLLHLSIRPVLLVIPLQMEITAKKWCKISCVMKIFKQFLEIIRNATN